MIDQPSPLEGIRVVEYGVFHAGPGAGAILGDLGADVIKIEAAAGDPERYWTVVGGMDIAAPATGESLMYEVSNRNKRGICVDIKTEAGREVLHRLVRTADVFLTNLRPPTKTALGIDFDNSPLRNNFRCRDDKWVIGVHHPEEKYWEPFCRATGREDLLADPRFATPADRLANVAVLVGIFDAVLAARDRDDWMRTFREHGLMFSPVQRLEEVLEDPQALANAYVVECDHPAHGRIRIPGYPIHFHGRTAGSRRPAPGIGEHTDTILAELGYTTEEIARLTVDGIARQAEAPPRTGETANERGGRHG